MRVLDRTCARASLGRSKHDERVWAFARLLIVALSLLVGCNSRPESAITPLVGTPGALVGTTITSTREPRSVTLPTPQVQTAPQGYYQDDDGLRLAISETNTQAIPDPDQDERAWHYVVLTLALTNYDEQTKDVTGFPFTIWLHEQLTNEDYAPELFAPSDSSLWFAIDKLNNGTVKRLEKNETVRGEIYFKAPAGVTRFDLIWQPAAQRQWILQVPELH